MACMGCSTSRVGKRWVHGLAVGGVQRVDGGSWRVAPMRGESLLARWNPRNRSITFALEKGTPRAPQVKDCIRNWLNIRRHGRFMQHWVLVRGKDPNASDQELSKGKAEYDAYEAVGGSAARSSAGVVMGGPGCRDWCCGCCGGWLTVGLAYGGAGAPSARRLCAAVRACVRLCRCWSSLALMSCWERSEHACAHCAHPRITRSRPTCTCAFPHACAEVSGRMLANRNTQLCELRKNLGFAGKRSMCGRTGLPYINCCGGKPLPVSICKKMLEGRCVGVRLPTQVLTRGVELQTVGHGRAGGCLVLPLLLPESRGGGGAPFRESCAAHHSHHSQPPPAHPSACGHPRCGPGLTTRHLTLRPLATSRACAAHDTQGL